MVAEARTDEGGKFKINDVAAGRYTVVAEATGSSKKEAEQEAARTALQKLRSLK